MSTNRLQDLIDDAPQVKATKQFDPATLNSPNGHADDAVVDVTSLGEGLRLTARATVEFSKDFATWLLELPEFKGDRQLRDEHVVYLKAAMERGTFRPDLVQIITCVLDGKEYRMNGQHTAWARIYVESERYRCPVQHLRYKARTEHDMRQLYATIDRGALRTTGNVVVSYLYGTSEFDGFTPKLVSTLAEGLAFWKWEMQHARTRHDGDERAYLLKTEYLPLAHKVGTFLKSKCQNSESRHVRRGSAVAAMFATFGRSATMSEEFWEAVRSGVGFDDSSDARLKLRNWLLSATVNTGAGSRVEGTRKVSREELYRACIHAWNAYRGGKGLQVIRPNINGPRPAAK